MRMSDRNAPSARIDPPVARIAVRGVAQRLARARATARQGARMIRRVPVIAGMVAGIAVAIFALAVVQSHYHIDRLELDKPPPDVETIAPWHDPHAPKLDVADPRSHAQR